MLMQVLRIIIVAIIEDAVRSPAELLAKPILFLTPLNTLFLGFRL